MNILIHDLNNKQFQSLFSEINSDIYIISDTGTIRHCIGCFGCWIKTPGKCVMKDGYNNIGKILSKAGKVTIISRCFYGCYSPFVKNILDRVFLGCFRSSKSKTTKHIIKGAIKIICSSQYIFMARILLQKKEKPPRSW